MSEKADRVVGCCGYAATTNNRSTFLRIAVEERRMQQRIEQLRAQLVARDLGAMLITAPANRYYLSGFSGSSGALLIGPETAILFTDGRYRLQAAQEAPAWTLRETALPTNPFSRLVAQAIAELHLERVGFEAAEMTVAAFSRLRQALNANDVTAELVPTDGLVEALRETKDAGELATLREAIAMTDTVMTTVLPMLRPEMSERQAAWLIEQTLHDYGADGPAFPIIVAAGPNSARPHHRSGSDHLGLSRPIVIDMGARLRGYHADLTRTVVLGSPDARFHNIYAVVLEAQRRAIVGMRPGLSCADADALARDHIAAEGFGDAFSHSLGHGVGLDIHEGPSLRRVADAAKSPVLQPGMVISIEPGIYLEDWGGVRIEDLVLLTDAGCTVLSQAPK
jgi:Xaa-Pro aminopeptidase